MKSCSRCGTENDESASSCARCGTCIAPPVIGEPDWPPTEPPPILLGRRLNGRIATLILGIYLGVQFAIGILVSLIASLIGAFGGLNLHDHYRATALTEKILPFASAAGLLAGGIAMLLASRSLMGEDLADRSPLGAAWARGSVRQMIQGLSFGVIVGLCYTIFVLAFANGNAPHNVGPVAKMATTPGLTRVLWLFMALLLAPPIEEFLFRGVLYGGYRAALGSGWAAVLVTLIFVMLHITETIYFPPAMVFITVLALAALWLRLRTSAIGPSIAVHFGYNSVIALLALWAA